MVWQGDPSDALYLLLSGEASVRLATQDEGSEIGRARRAPAARPPAPGDLRPNR